MKFGKKAPVVDGRNRNGNEQVMWARGITQIQTEVGISILIQYLM